MSTLMSKDLNIVRPSTRLHAPPGGKSSISFGGDDDSKVKAQSNPPKAAPTSSATPILSENVNPQKESDSSAPIRRVRQAPGGSSSIVIG